MGDKRVPVNLRFSLEDTKIMEAIVKREMGPQTSLRVGLKQIILKIMQEYINQIKEGTAHGAENSTGITEGEPVPNADSPVLPDP